MKWNDASTAGELLWSAVIKHAVGEWRKRLPLPFLMEENILSICCNKDDVMWYVWLFGEIITVTRVCRYSVNHFQADGRATHSEFIVVNGQTMTSKGSVAILLK